MRLIDESVASLVYARLGPARSRDPIGQKTTSDPSTGRCPAHMLRGELDGCFVHQLADYVMCILRIILHTMPAYGIH